MRSIVLKCSGPMSEWGQSLPKWVIRDKSDLRPIATEERTSRGVGAMLAPGLFVWHQFVTVPADATEIEVMGQQWRWSFRLPGKDGRMGTSDVRNISSDNPLGLNPDDPHGQDDVVIESGDLHLPIAKPVKVLLRSLDVLHNFYEPEFRAKMDMVPGMVTYFWMTPIRTGTFDVLCAEGAAGWHRPLSGRFPACPAAG
jgi:cytochrome c oxidase subunit II